MVDWVMVVDKKHRQQRSMKITRRLYSIEKMNKRTKKDD